MDLFLKLLKNKLKVLIPDSLYIRYEYLKLHRKFYSKNKVLTFSDRIFSWKLNKKLTDFSIFVDKYKVRSFVADKCGEKYLPTLLKICTVAEDFNLTEMPDKFVVKLNNGSGYNLVINNKNDHCNAEIRQKDYKFYCIEGAIEFVQVISQRTSNKQTHNYYSKLWQPLPILRAGCDIGELEPKPNNFAEAVVIAEALSSSFSFVRVDLYIQDKIYFGELTFTPGNGYIRFLPEKFDRELASKMKLGFKNNG